MDGSEQIWDLSDLLSGPSPMSATLDDVFLLPRLYPHSIAGSVRESTKSSPRNIKWPPRVAQTAVNKVCACQAPVRCFVDMHVSSQWQEGRCTARAAVPVTSGGQHSSCRTAVVRQEEIGETESTVVPHLSREEDGVIQSSPFSKVEQKRRHMTPCKMSGMCCMTRRVKSQPQGRVPVKDGLVETPVSKRSDSKTISCNTCPTSTNRVRRSVLCLFSVCIIMDHGQIRR